jgi:hypothetical protein
MVLNNLPSHDVPRPRMRFGLEQPPFLFGKRGFSWTNPPDYGKIPAIDLLVEEKFLHNFIPNGSEYIELLYRFLRRFL